MNNAEDTAKYEMKLSGEVTNPESDTESVDSSDAEMMPFDDSKEISLVCAC
jgi:hypothetical protein